MVFSDSLKKIFLAGIGAAAMTAEAAKDLIDQLVTKGELTAEQGKVLNEELRHNIKQKVNDHVTVNIVKEYKDVMNAVDHMNKEERDQLRAKLNAADAAEAASASGPLTHDAVADGPADVSSDDSAFADSNSGIQTHHSDPSEHSGNAHA